MRFLPQNLRLFAIAATTLGLPAVAHAGEHSFERGGVSYVYTSTVENGRTILKGTADRTPFRFVVGDRYVRGHYDYRPVEFPKPATRAAKSNTAVASAR